MVKRQAFAAASFLFECEEAGDAIVVVFASRPALLLDPTDRELERGASSL
jgi:hypothetical protein